MLAQPTRYDAAFDDGASAAGHAHKFNQRINVEVRRRRERDLQLQVALEGMRADKAKHRGTPKIQLLRGLDFESQSAARNEQRFIGESEQQQRCGKPPHAR